MASGRLTEKVKEEDSMLYEFEIGEAERTIPDSIGFLICPTLLTSPFDIHGKKD